MRSDLDRPELHDWADWLDDCGVPRSAIRNVDNDLGALFDFVDPDGIQLEFLFLDTAKLPPQSPAKVFAE